MKSERHMVLTKREEWDVGKEGGRMQDLSAAAKGIIVPSCQLYFAGPPWLVQARSKAKC